MNANDILFYIVILAFTIMVTVLTNSINEHIAGKSKQPRK